MGGDSRSLQAMLGMFGVHLKVNYACILHTGNASLTTTLLQPSCYDMDVKPLLKEVCSRIYGSATGIVDMLVGMGFCCGRLLQRRHGSCCTH